MTKGSECGKYSKIDLKSKYTQNYLNEKYYQPSSLSTSARVIQVIKWTLGVRISYLQGLEVYSNWNLSTLSTRAFHYLGNQIG